MGFRYWDGGFGRRNVNGIKNNGIRRNLRLTIFNDSSYESSFLNSSSSFRSLLTTRLSLRDRRSSLFDLFLRFLYDRSGRRRCRFRWDYNPVERRFTFKTGLFTSSWRCCVLRYRKNLGWNVFRCLSFGVFNDWW